MTGPPNPTRYSLIVTSLAIAATVTLSRADVPIYGSPLLDFDGGDAGHFVSSSGVAVGSATRGELGTLGSRAVRWDALGNAVELGTLGADAGGTAYAKVFAMNDVAQAVGYAQKYVGADLKGIRAVRWNPSTNAATELSTLGEDAAGVTSVYASAINGAGVIGGVAEKYVAGDYVGTRAVRWTSTGTISELGHLGLDAAGQTNAGLFAINAGNVAAGWSEKHSGATDSGRRAVYWKTDGTAVELATLGTASDGSSSAYAQAINSFGVTAGASWKYDNGTYVGERAVRWGADGQALELQSLGANSSGEAKSAAVAIIDSGETAGTSEKYAGGVDLGTRAVRWNNAGQVTELANLGTASNGLSRTEAYAMNLSQQVAGLAAVFVNGDYAGEHAVVWQPNGSATDLNDLISPTSGWTLKKAESITNNGWVAGGGVFIPNGGTQDQAVYRFFSININAENAWASSGRGNWNDASHWIDQVAPGVARDVSISATNNTIDVTGAAYARNITVGGPGTLTLQSTGDYLHTNGVVIVAAPVIFSGGSTRIPMLNSSSSVQLRDGARLEIVPEGPWGTGVSVTRSLVIPTRPAGFDGTLDLHNTDLIVDYTGGVSTYGSVLAMLKSGLTSVGGNETGIASSDVAAGTIPGTTLGLLDNATVGITTLSGHAGVPLQSVLVKYTWLGDANLDGVVNGSDYALLDTGFAGGGSTWGKGDFNYSGTINGSDYALIDSGFAAQAGTLPEPAAVSLVGAFACALLARRRRSFAGSDTSSV